VVRFPDKAIGQVIMKMSEGEDSGRISFARMTTDWRRKDCRATLAMTKKILDLPE